MAPNINPYKNTTSPLFNIWENFLASSAVLTSKEISHAIISAIEMNNRGFINELNIWATNPFN